MLNKKRITRRQFIVTGSMVGAAAMLAACGPAPATEAPAAATNTPAPAAVATNTPAPAAAATNTPAPVAEVIQDVSNRNLEQIVRLSETKINLRGFSSPLYVAVDVKTFNDQLFDKKMEEVTNVHIAWTAAADWGDGPLELLMAGGDLPDVMAGYAPRAFVSYGMKGALEPLNDYINGNPYLSGLMKKFPPLRGMLTAPDGKIYCWPRYLEGKTKCFAGWFARQDWLAEVGMPAPDTVDQCYEVLKAFKQKDPERWPFTRDPRAFIWLWGVGSRGPNCPTDFYHENDTVKYGPIQPQYREALVFINKLFKEGLIDAEYQQSMSSDDFFFQRFINGISGLSMQWSLDGIAKPLYANDPKAKIVGIKTPKGPYGHQEVLSNHFGIDPTESSAMSANCKYKDILARYMDFYYSDSGATLMNWGVYGDTYTEVNGKKVYTDKVTKDPKLMPAEYMWNWVSPVWIGAMVVTEEATIAQFGPIGVDAQAWSVWSAEAWQTIQMPPVYLTQDEEDIVKPIMTDMNTLVDENTNGFITGTKSLDQDYNDMVATIKSKGIEDATKAHQAAYDRYLAALKAAQ